MLYATLTAGFGLGLAAHVAGNLLGGGDPDTLQALVADLLANLGIALWTGVVLVVFIDVLPEVQRRAAARELAAYEATLAARGAAPGKRPAAGRRPMATPRAPGVGESPTGC